MGRVRSCLMPSQKALGLLDFDQSRSVGLAKGRPKTRPEILNGAVRTATRLCGRRGWQSYSSGNEEEIRKVGSRWQIGATGRTKTNRVDRRPDLSRGGRGNLTRPFTVPMVYKTVYKTARKKPCVTHCYARL